jgi:hypothetical protein
MRLLKDLAETSASGNDTKRVQVGVTREIVGLVVLHVDSLLDARHLVNLTAIVQYGIGMFHGARVAFEVHDIDLVETLHTIEYFSICNARNKALDQVA